MEQFAVAPDLDYNADALEGFNPDFDFNVGPRPIPDGTYVAQVTLQDPDPETRWNGTVRNGKPGFSAKVMARVVEGRFAGRVVFGFVSTRVNKRGTNSAAEYVSAAGRGDELRTLRSHADLRDLVNSISASEPIIKIYTRWEATEKVGDQYVTLIQGMKNFPELEPGIFNHVVPVTDGNVEAQAKISRFFQL